MLPVVKADLPSWTFSGLWPFAGKHLSIEQLNNYLRVVINHLGSEGRLDILRHEPSGQKFKQAVHDHPIFGALIGPSSLDLPISFTICF
jgi:hypothetical protein